MATQVKRRRGRLTPNQARTARRQRRQRRKRYVRLMAFLGVGIISILFIFALFASGIQSVFGPNRGAPEGPGERYQAQPSTHIEIGDTHPSYSTKPATSGWHYDEAASWGVKNEPVPEERLIHNLEHGGVVIYYNCPEGCPETVEKLAEIVNKTDETILAPYPDMETIIALTEWTFIERLNEYDEDRVKAFIRAHLNSPNAPEPLAR